MQTRMRPTTSDIAREARVSLATVDRVINERPGVKTETVNKVNAAIKHLGYVRDVSAANLAKKRRYQLVFVLPDDSSEFLTELIRQINAVRLSISSDRTEIRIKKVAANDPHKLVSQLRKIKRQSVDGVAIMARTTPQSRDAIAELRAAGIAVVALVSDQPSSDVDHFVGIDNVAAGKTAGRLMGRFVPSNIEKGKIVVLTNSIQSYDSLNRRHGFDEILREEFPHLNVLPTIEGHGNTERIYRALENTIKNNQDIVGIYSLSSGNRAVTEFIEEAAISKKLTVIVHELTEHSKNGLRDSSIDAVITQHRGQIVRSAIRVLKAKSDKTNFDMDQEQIRVEIVLKENLAN